jgi:DNA repair protein RecO (recombination protein O)
VRSYKTDGIVLKRKNFGEADKILTVLTRNYGKLHLIAKGVRSTRSRKAPRLELFCLTKLLISKGRNLDLINDVEIISNYSNIRKSLKRIAYAYQICEIVDRLLPEQQINRSLFILLEREFVKLNSVVKIADYHLNKFILELLWDLGYLPKDKILSDDKINTFVENLIERRLKSNQLLTRIDNLIV